MGLTKSQYKDPCEPIRISRFMWCRFFSRGSYGTLSWGVTERHLSRGVGSVRPLTFATHNFPTVVKVISRVKQPQSSSYFQAFIGAPSHHPPSNHRLWAYLVVFPFIGNAVQERRYKNKTCHRPFLASFLRWCFFPKKMQPGGSTWTVFSGQKEPVVWLFGTRSFFAKPWLPGVALRTFHATDGEACWIPKRWMSPHGTASIRFGALINSGESTSWRNVGSYQCTNRGC